MTTLLDTLQSAGEGSRDLDGEIAVAVKLWNAEDIHHCGGGVCVSASQSLHHAVPHYTTSLDAAVSLVPEGRWWEVRQMADPKSPMRGDGIFTARVGFSYGSVGFPAHHDEPAIALVAAALKARDTTP